MQIDLLHNFQVIKSKSVLYILFIFLKLDSEVTSYKKYQENILSKRINPMTSCQNGIQSIMAPRYIGIE